jgi:hypothetical protein
MATKRNKKQTGQISKTKQAVTTRHVRDNEASSPNLDPADQNLE